MGTKENWPVRKVPIWIRGGRGNKLDKYGNSAIFFCIIQSKIFWNFLQKMKLSFKFAREIREGGAKLVIVAVPFFFVHFFSFSTKFPRLLSASLRSKRLIFWISRSKQIWWKNLCEQSKFLYNQMFFWTNSLEFLDRTVNLKNLVSSFCTTLLHKKNKLFQNVRIEIREQKNEDGLKFCFLVDYKKECVTFTIDTSCSKPISRLTQWLWLSHAFGWHAKALSSRWEYTGFFSRWIPLVMRWSMNIPAS